MKIVIPGGGGQIGAVLARSFVASGDEVVVLSRGGAASPGRVVAWDGATLGAWADELDGADVLINLAGKSVNCRYHAQNRDEMMRSRIASTRVLGQAVARVKRPPRTWLQSSTATIYAHRYDAPNDEATGLIGGGEPDVPRGWDFSIEIATAWERELLAASTPRTRKVAMRMAIVMCPDFGSVFELLLNVVRRGLGGRQGDGRQWVSWLHDVDFVRSVRFLIEREDLSGAVNLAAPAPLPNADFMRAFREAWGVRVGLPAPAFLLELVAPFLRTETELPLKSRRVVPRRMLDAGFRFEFPEWPAAVRDLCARRRALEAKR